MPITSTTQQQATLSLAAVTPGNSAIGDTAAAGTSGSVARADHKHGREAAATPGSSAVGDSASAGSATTIARSDHVHGREAFGTPVTVNGQTTSLSAGSLTTVARADHVHTLSNVAVLLYSTTLGATAANISITNIPSTYSHLLIYASLRSAYSGQYYDNYYVRLNNDTGSNYSDQINGATATQLGGFTVNAAANFLTNTWSTHVIQIWNYSNTSVHKSVVWPANPGYNNSASAWSPAVATGGFINVWKSTAAVNRIDIYPFTGPWAPQTSIMLYGLP